MQALIDSVIQVESGGDPDAVSPAGARGLMQLMPSTARQPGFGVKPMQDDSPEENVRVGSQLLEAFLRRYDYDLTMTLVAYNWGPGNAARWLRGGADYSELPQETQDYIGRVRNQLRLRHVYL